MKLLACVFLFLASVLSGLCADTSKPWTWWWIFGNATEKADITSQLEWMAENGIGGVCVIPVYGDAADKEKFVDLFSPRFMENLEYISSECRRLGLGLDMTMGSGWPFGGPMIDEKNSSKKIGSNLECVPTKGIVRRAAPGGEGFTIDPLSPESNEIYSRYIKNIFAPYKEKKLIRAFFCDSYEFFGADFTDNFYAEFKKRRGYDFKPHASVLLSKEKSDANRRLMHDYHETVSDLVYDGIGRSFTETSRSLGFQSVYQAHGSPANILDLYELADIPETESFGASAFDIPNLRYDRRYRGDTFGRPSEMAFKLCSSAAHVSGKRLVSSETCTWLANHFQVSLSMAKPEIDRLFASGINHIFYHGTPYTPRSAGFPGRLFYASTNFNFNSHFKEFYPLLNAYVRDVQSVMQKSESDTDVLLYFPIHDMWSSSADMFAGNSSRSGRKGIMMEVHTVSNWLCLMPDFQRLFDEMTAAGFFFDFVSDRRLARLEVENGAIKSGGKYYKTLVVPHCQNISSDTLKALDSLARKGAKIAFDVGFPQDVAGFGNVGKRRAELAEFVGQWSGLANVSRGKAVELAAANGAKAETFAQNGLVYYRGNLGGNLFWFISNLKAKNFLGSLRLSKDAESFEYFNPVTRERARLEKRADKDGGAYVDIGLRSGESCLVFAKQKTDNNLAVKKFLREGESQKIGGEWKIEFLRGVPVELPKGELPPPATVRELKSWTEFGGEKAASFCGVARYSTSFKTENPDADYRLDLGDVRDAAKVKINGRDLGAVWCVPFTVDIKRGILRKNNKLEIEVQNNSFNLARSFFRKNPRWNDAKRLYDITYRGKYDISDSPLEPSGLLGDVRLVLLK